MERRGTSGQCGCGDSVVWGKEGRDAVLYVLSWTKSDTLPSNSDPIPRRNFCEPDRDYK